MGDAVLALLPLYALALYFYGVRSLVNMALSVLVCLISDWLCQRLAGRKQGLADLSPIVTGMLIPLMLPASIGYPVIVMADLFAILVIKHPFGGLGQNLFNPAAGGIAFVAITWPQQVFSYPNPLEYPPLLGEVTRLANSPASRLKLGTAPSQEFLDLLIGDAAGPMGTTHILVLLACLLFLIARKAVSGRAVLAFLASSGLFAFLFPRIGGDRLQSIWCELLSGALLFGAIFLLGDPTTSPKRESSKVIYAAVAGVVTMLFRYFGVFEEGIFFAVLLMNAFVWPIDMKVEEYHSKQRRKRLEKKPKKV